MTKYCFFGSSVTEQSKLHATGEIVGYVDYLINNYLNQDGNKFLRIAKGNTNITNAGVLFLNDIIKWKPDFCILDWCTASDPRADRASVYYIYEQLLLNGITPITVIFPRKDRKSINTQVYKESSLVCSYLKTQFIEIDPEEELDKILRDVVHTNALGGAIYAKKVFKAIEKKHVNNPSLIEYYNREEYIYTSEINIEKKGRVNGFYFEINNDLGNSMSLQIFMEQLIGPYSPILITSLNGDNVYSENLFDQWCGRERVALKAVTPLISLHEGNNEICTAISDEIPDYTCLEKSVVIKDRYLNGVMRAFFIVRTNKEIYKFSEKKFTLEFKYEV